MKGKIGYLTTIVLGDLAGNHPDRMVSEAFCHAMPGDWITLRKAEYSFVVSLYTLERNPKYIHSYDYPLDEAWVTYEGNVKGISSYQKEPYVFAKECYFRLTFKRDDGKAFEQKEAENIWDIVEFCHSSRTQESAQPVWFQEEVQRCLQEIPEDMTYFFLLSDSHVVDNGTWETTVQNMRAMRQQMTENGRQLQGILHLGDFTDGLLGKEERKRRVEKILGDLQEISSEVVPVIGNHDTNYFRANPEVMTAKEVHDLYLKNVTSAERNYYRKDFPLACLSLLVLESFHPGELPRYCYKDEMLDWLEKELQAVPAANRVMVCSHIPPTAGLDYWDDTFGGSRRLLEILERFQQQSAGRLLGFFHGHTHADRICSAFSFPIISIGANKTEDFQSRKPHGSRTPERNLDVFTQDLWDILCVSREGDLSLVRFGAGENRRVCKHYVNHKTKIELRLHEQERRIANPTKIWAHRGSTAECPENTIASFRKAMEEGADGIELDVQLTRDGEVVVIHDETLERVSNGQGQVKDYTLAELRQFSFARQRPERGFTEISTLREVLELLKDTKLCLNIELKNSVEDYPGLEEKTIQLVKAYGMEERVWYSSFNHKSMMEVLRIDSGAKTGLLYIEKLIHPVEYAKAAGAAALHPAMHLLSREFVEECHRAGVKVHVWTVNEKDAMQKALACGVDALITNHPGRALICRKDYEELVEV